MCERAQVDEVEDLRVLHALDLQLRVGARVGRHEGRRRHAEHVLRELLLVHQLRPRHAHQLDADAHEADVVDVGRDVGPGPGEAHPGAERSAASRRCRAACARAGPSCTMNSPRTMPCVLVLPPRSKPPGFHRSLICSREARDDRIDEAAPRRAAVVPRRSAGPRRPRCRLISAVVKRASGSRSSASKAGRTKGSKRRSSCSSADGAVSPTKLRQRRAGVGARHAGGWCSSSWLLLQVRCDEIAQRANAGQEEVGAAAAR